MKCQVKRIEVLDERDFDRLIEDYDIERFMCSIGKCSDSESVLRIVIYANRDMFGELTEQLNDLCASFRAYGGRKEKMHYTAVEFIV